MRPRCNRLCVRQGPSFRGLKVVRADLQVLSGEVGMGPYSPPMYGDLRASILSGQFLRHPHLAAIGNRPFLLARTLVCWALRAWVSGARRSKARQATWNLP